MKGKKPVVILVAIMILVGGGFALWSGKDAAVAEPEAVAEEKAPVTVTDSPAPTKSADAVRAEAAYTGTRKLEGGKYVTVVTLTDAGFQPPIISINRGESVRFVNKSGSSMRIASNDFQGIPILAGLNQEKSVGANGTYALTVTETGVWGYNNRNSATPVVMGIIHVK